METGFKELDKIIDLRKPQVILLTGTIFTGTLLENISNNVCLTQKCEILKIVSFTKEYMLKRMLVSECDLDFKKWNKNKYTDEEFKRIGQYTVNLFNTKNKLPTIIEYNMNIHKLNKIKKFISNFVNIINSYEKEKLVEKLVTIDILPLNEEVKEKGVDKLFKSLNRISNKLKCPIIIIYDNESLRKHYITKGDIDNIKVINKYIDTTIIVNDLKDELVSIDVYDTETKIGTCKLKYDFRCRKFIDY